MWRLLRLFWVHCRPCIFIGILWVLYMLLIIFSFITLTLMSLMLNWVVLFQIHFIWHLISFAMILWLPMSSGSMGFVSLFRAFFIFFVIVWIRLFEKIWMIIRSPNFVMHSRSLIDFLFLKLMIQALFIEDLLILLRNNIFG